MTRELKELDREAKRFITDSGGKREALSALDQSINRGAGDYAKKLYFHILDQSPEIREEKRQQYERSVKLDRLLSERVECVKAAKDTLKLPPAQRKARYEHERACKGEQAAQKLVAEVRKQRQKQQGIEM